jgi:hypothetical protein
MKQELLVAQQPEPAVVFAAVFRRRYGLLDLALPTYLLLNLSLEFPSQFPLSLNKLYKI